MPITKLRFSNVGPFDEVEFEFDPQVNVFTGPNNSGKSSALWVLGDIAVYPFRFPRKLLRREGAAEFELHLQNTSERMLTGQLPCTIQTTGPEDPEGYWTVERTRDYISALAMIGYSKFIPALRRSTDFRSPGPTLAQRGDSESRRAAEEEPDPELRKRLTLVLD